MELKFNLEGQNLNITCSGDLSLGDSTGLTEQLLKEAKGMRPKKVTISISACPFVHTLAYSGIVGFRISENYIDLPFTLIHSEKQVENVSLLKLKEIFNLQRAV